MARAPATLRVTVELFGMARIHGRAKELTLALPPDVEVSELAASLRQACPGLVGTVIREDLSGLEEGYAFNLNGLAFVGGDTVRFQPGDSLLVLSSQAGG